MDNNIIVYLSPSILHNLSDSTDDSYGNFKKHLSRIDDDNDNDAKNSQDKKGRNVVPSSPRSRLKSKKLFSRLPSRVPRLRRSVIAQFCSESDKQLENLQSLEYSPGHATTRSKQNNKSAGTLQDDSLQVKSTGKTNRTNDQFENGEKTNVNESEAHCEESVHALSDTAVDLFLQKFDNEMTRDSHEVVTINCDSSVAVETEETCTSLQRTIQSETSKTKVKVGYKSQKKRTNGKALGSSDTDSISSVTSNVSRYGRVRRSPTFYVQATMFDEKTGKPDEFKQKVSSSINSHRCQNRTFSTSSISSSIDETGNQKSSQTVGLIPPHNKKTLLNRSRSGSTFSNFEKSAVVENVSLNSSPSGKLVNFVKPLQTVERDSSKAETSDSIISPDTYEPVDMDIRLNLFRLAKKPDQSKIYASVDNEMISLKWFAPQPNLDVELSKDTDNMHCSLPDFKQYFSTSSAGYLKIEAGRENSMPLLRECYMFYKVETGEAIVNIKMPERKRVAQVGSMFFIPQGTEYTIRNSSAEEDLILLFVKMSAPT